MKKAQSLRNFTVGVAVAFSAVVLAAGPAFAGVFLNAWWGGAEFEDNFNSSDRMIACAKSGYPVRASLWQGGTNYMSATDSTASGCTSDVRWIPAGTYSFYNCRLNNNGSVAECVSTQVYAGN